MAKCESLKKPRRSPNERMCIMIRGMHAMFYSSQADALRAFFRDKLGLAGTDVGGGWLIFDLGFCVSRVDP